MHLISSKKILYSIKKLRPFQINLTSLSIFLKNTPTLLKKMSFLFEFEL